MESERIKTYIIVFFVLLNLALGGLLVMENRRNWVTTQEAERILTILANNNITLDALPMRHFPPMRPMYITGFYYQVDALVEMFFPNPTVVRQEERFGGYFFQDHDSSLSISGGFVFFESENGFRSRQLAVQSPELANVNAMQTIDNFIASYFPTFVQDSSMVLGDGEATRIIYRQEYRGHLIHSNFIEFILTPVGIVQIEMQFGEVVGFTGTPTNIFSVDEALLIFAQRVHHITQVTPKTIVHIDLAYFQEYFSEQNTPYQGAPFYRIFTYCSGDRPFLINAFTNIIID